MSPRTKEQTAGIRDERRQQILIAAHQVFSAQGFHNTKISDVAATAEASHGTVYHYFSSKDELFMAVFEAWVASYISQASVEELSALKSSSEQLSAFAQSTAQAMIHSAEFLPVQMEFWSHLVRNEKIRQRFRELFANLRSILRGIIQTGIDSGEFRQVDAEAVASIAMATYDGLILQTLADPGVVDWQNISKIFVELTLSYLQISKE
jgi:AcrR family transcriptional regulator